MGRKATQSIAVFVFLLAIIICLPAGASVRKRIFHRHRNADTVQTIIKAPEIYTGRGMMTSAYPVKISITGRAVRIQSDRSQLLPIYTQSGALYLTARLNKGTNWLSGLPNGHYFINNRPVCIGH